MIGYSRKLMVLALANAQGYDIKHLTPEQFRACENLWCDVEPIKEKKNFLQELDEMEPAARVLRVSRAKYLELQDIKNRKSELFDAKRENWWLHLRNAMRKFRIDKNTLAQYGIDWAECRKFYFQAV